MAHSRLSADGHDDGLNEDGALDTPLHRLQGFGTGLHRQRVAFVKAGETPTTAKSPASRPPGGAVSDLYLSIVMGQAATATSTTVATVATVAATVDTSGTEPAPACEVCRLPLPTSSSSAKHTHETCLVHQVSLDHSKPPSSLNRSRFGLAIMSAQGWDPDSGRGLGADQQGMAYPIEARLRPERQALGHETGSVRASAGRDRPAGTAASNPVPTRNRSYTRKQLRAMEEDRRRRHDRLREQIMSHRDLDKYLRPQEGE